ncbi:aldehyde ferredoxin oxidoreductase N-terminal domain-containing protein [Desulfobacula toluolica]|uniref:Putative tungsten-containing aldehyde ferredoxin:oxidoreductase n=1 Tax=Desulfobacula toluolica (strain DSM 7467 / Tol2) TaxID=651182 RepID=K0NCN7_DESTT|nr:aldehyde ferredoxin oxidoreductase N-terminal domain-containing protein [Desulfobacula toluolica]CCK78596.1 putative tungsten-containing aldehyde ferredoxin:oxidoreductase [Desulfobacula toluolica Tol2]
MTTDRKIALVDLGRSEVETFPISMDLEQRFLGGSGVATYLFCKHAPKMCDPGSADNICIVSAGYLSGTLSAPLGTAVLTSKSAATGLMARACVDGPFAAQMRRAGFEHLVLKGRAENETCLLIQDGCIEFKEIPGLKDNGLSEQRAMLRKENPGIEAQLVCIQKNGDGLFFAADACLDLSKDVEGMEPDKSGVAEVLAAKNVVTLACCGTIELEVKDPEGIIAYEKKHLENIDESLIQNDPEPVIIEGPAGSVNLTEIKQTIEQCLGLPSGTKNCTNSSELNFQIAADRILLNTGLALDEDELKEIAYRCIAMERIYNLGEGITSKQGQPAEDYGENEWTREAVLKKEKVFEPLRIDDLWGRLKS